MAEETLKDFILKRPECVFKYPNNEYYSFINLYVFVNGETPNREASIKKARASGHQMTGLMFFPLCFQKGKQKWKD